MIKGKKRCNITIIILNSINNNNDGDENIKMFYHHVTRGCK